MEEFETISYKLGKAILDAKKIKGLITLPKKLLEIRKDALERKEYSKKYKNILVVMGSENFSLLSFYQEYGIDGLNIYLKYKCANNKELQAKILIDLSKLLRQEKDTNYIAVARMATYLSNSEPVLRNFAWCAIDANLIDEFKETLDKLKYSYGTSNDICYLNTYKKFEKKLHLLKKEENNQENNQEKIELQYINHKTIKNFPFQIEKIFKEIGFKKLVESVVWTVQKDNLSLEEHAFILLRIAKVITQFDKQLELQLIDKALGLCKTEKICKAALRSLDKSFEIKKTKELVKYILCNNYSEELRLLAQKSHVYAMLIEDEIPKSNFKTIDYIEKRICYVLHNSLPYSSGGYATRALGICQGLKTHGYETIVINRPGFPIDTKPEILPIDVKPEEKVDDFVYVRSNFPTRKQYKTYDYMRLAADVLEEQFSYYRPQYVIAASNFITAIPAMIAAKRLGIPFFYEVRGFWEITRISREPEFALTPSYKSLCYLEAVAAKNADKVFTLTNAMKSELINRGVDKSITILPNSCNPEDFTPTGRNEELAKKLKIHSHIPVIGYIGTFVQYEGLDILAEACGILKQKGCEFRLLMVGNENTSGNDRGPITEKVYELAAQYDYVDWLIMPGRVPHEQVESYYSLVDVAPFPRKPQPVSEMVSPMKPLEASAMKKAIVVSSVQALTEMIVDGETGLVFEKGNARDLANKLEILINDSALRFKLGENGRKWVERERTWTLTTKKITNELEMELIENE